MVDSINDSADELLIAFADWQRENLVASNALLSRARALMAHTKELRSQCNAELDGFSLAVTRSMLLADKICRRLDAQQLILRGRSVWLTPDADDSDYKLGPLDISIGSYLRSSRKQHNLSLAYVAKALGIQEFALAAYEAGRQRIPHDIIENLVDLYDATPM